jgi:hypothetical protein
MKGSCADVRRSLPSSALSCEQRRAPPGRDSPAALRLWAG